jgi:hypothetical protein
MTIFASKDAFMALGLEQVNPSAAHASQDCAVCTKPLAVHDRTISTHVTLKDYHPTVRVSSCGHIHGQECLQAWLNVGNSCPICSRILFELSGDKITQRDINDVVRTLGREHGEARIMNAVARLMQKQEQEHTLLRRFHEQEVAKQKIKDNGGQDEGFMPSDDGFLNSDTEIDFGEDDADEE